MAAIKSTKATKEKADISQCSQALFQQGQQEMPRRRPK
jgi:hypothetical protein